MPTSVTRKVSAFYLLFAFALPSAAQVNGDVNSETVFRADSRRPSRPDSSPKIEALLKQMTVEEKVGQMTQLTIERDMEPVRFRSRTAGRNHCAPEPKGNVLL
jgi:hypothetical protein